MCAHTIELTFINLPLKKSGKKFLCIEIKA